MITNQLTNDFLRSVFLDMFGDPVTNPMGWDVHLSGELFIEKPRIGTTQPARGKGLPVVRVGEVVKAERSTEGGTALPAHQLSYSFDGIGNRLTSGTGDVSRSYTPNALNQSSSQTHSGNLSIFGKAPVTDTITVNSQASNRIDNYFHRKLDYNNSSSPLWENVSITDGTNTGSGNHFIPQASVTPTHDLDGNLISDGQWDYTWDAENRLTSVTRSTAAQNAGAPYVRIEYSYDSQSRRFQRQQFDSVISSTPVETLLYLYDDWNCIAEYSVDTASVKTLHKTHVWGLDISGTPQGAGGVAGLVMTTHPNPSSNTPFRHGASSRRPCRSTRCRPQVDSPPSHG